MRGLSSNINYTIRAGYMPLRGELERGVRYGYQGQFAEKDAETNKNSFELRQYDPLLGRWMTIDPAGQYHSPYMAMDNNPVSSIDEDGGFAGVGSLIGLGVGAAIGVYNAYNHHEKWYVGVGEAAIGAAAGSLAGTFAEHLFRYGLKPGTWVNDRSDWLFLEARDRLRRPGLYIENHFPKIDFVRWSVLRWDSWTMLGGIAAQGTYQTSFSIPTLQGGNIRVTMDPGFSGNAATWNVNYNGTTKSATVSDITDGWHFPIGGSGKSSVVTINVNRPGARTVVFEYVRSSIILKRPRIRLR